MATPKMSPPPHGKPHEVAAANLPKTLAIAPFDSWQIFRLEHESCDILQNKESDCEWLPSHTVNL